jgi:hypothetical protein
MNFMALVQKNVTVPKPTWDRLRCNAQASGVPLCIYLAHLIDQSVPVALDDRKNQEVLTRMELDRDRERHCDTASE